LLARAFEETARATLTAAAIKSKMVALDPSFYEHNYGYRDFREFLNRFPSASVRPIAEWGHHAGTHQRHVTADRSSALVGGNP
jgi:hypothetical protein